MKDNLRKFRILNGQLQAKYTKEFRCTDRVEVGRVVSVMSKNTLKISRMKLEVLGIDKGVVVCKRAR